MKINKQKLSRKKILLIAIVVILVIAGYATSAALLKLFPFSPEKSTSFIPQNNTNNKPTKSELKNNDSIDAPTDKTTDEVQKSPSLTASITQLEQKNGKILFNSSIANSTKSGHCVIKFSTVNEKPVVKELEATNKSGNTAICGPLMVSELEFSYLGEWTVGLSYYENETVSTTSSTIRIQ